MSNLTVEERLACLDTWRYCTDMLNAEVIDIADMPEQLQAEMRETFLEDIPLRDAILAEIALYDEGREAAKAMLTKVAADGNVPAVTILAAIDFLESKFDDARAKVASVLETEEYSLARLLHNGLEMRAPASLLQRSLTHYTPEDLCKA